MSRWTVQIAQRLRAGGGQACCGIALMLGALTGGCAHHVRLVVPQTTGSNAYVCRPGEKECASATTDDPRMWNEAGTKSVVLPTNCDGRINEILVRNADSSTPEVLVKCAPLENKIEGMK